MIKENYQKVIAKTKYLIDALNCFEEKVHPYEYDFDFEIHLKGYVLTVTSGELLITPTSEQLINDKENKTKKEKSKENES